MSGPHSVKRCAFSTSHSSYMHSVPHLLATLDRTPRWLHLVDRMCLSHGRMYRGPALEPNNQPSLINNRASITSSFTLLSSPQPLSVHYSPPPIPSPLHRWGGGAWRPSTRSARPGCLVPSPASPPLSSPSSPSSSSPPPLVTDLPLIPQPLPLPPTPLHLPRSLPASPIRSALQPVGHRRRAFHRARIQAFNKIRLHCW
jgi:hypothetical protein